MCNCYLEEYHNLGNAKFLLSVKTKVRLAQIPT
uniref:Uncharacterized protein n=1 Tax=Anguilla anguilla TaxID=7936 RepID=A0A0E9VRA1_ANGAN